MIPCDQLTPATITGSVKRDIAIIEEVIGVKTTISNHRGSQMSVHELARLSSEARFSNMLGARPESSTSTWETASRGWDR
jgi:hypothetical protein